MNYLLGFLVYLPAALAGGLLLHALWHGTQPAHLLLKLGLGIGLGLGLTSLLTFLTLLLTNKLVGFVAIQFILLLIGIILTWRNWKTNPLLPERFALTRIQWILLGAFVLILLVTASAYAIYAAMTPNGRFDAWMIYNRTARFIFRDPTNWQNTLSPEMYWLFHADYPLLIPVNVAGAWNTLGSEIMRAPQAQSAYFLLGMFCVLMGAIAHLRTAGQSLLAGITLLAVPIFYYTAAREEADIPLAFFILATLALLFLYSRESKPALIALAGLAAGFAGWTKNEGLLFLVTGSFAWLVLLYRRREIKELKWYALGLALPLAVILYFKLFLTPPNDLFDQSSSTGIAERLADFGRYSLIGNSFYRQIFVFGSGELPILMIAIYGLIVGLDRSADRRQPTLAATAAFLLQLAGYFMIYVLTPHDLNWHIRTSLYRLMIHIVPSALLIFFLSISDPETLFGKT
jgi:4-amino-4-deoxy-L-arabinose transferase-like glycosyltransferase